VTRAVVFAYHDVGCRCLEVLLDHRVDVPLVLTHGDAPAENIWFASVARLAREKGVETIAPEDPNAPAIIDRIRALAPDFLFSFYYRMMLGQALLAIPRRGAFNMHGSLLPKYRGRVPVNWAIIQGESETGATLHEMVAKPDAGRIVDQESVPIAPDDLAVDVFRKVTGAAGRVLARSRRARRRHRRAAAAGSGQELLAAASLRTAISTGSAREAHPRSGASGRAAAGAFTEVEGNGSASCARACSSAGNACSPATLHAEDGRRTVCADGGVLELLETGTGRRGALRARIRPSHRRPQARALGSPNEKNPDPRRERFIGHHLSSASSSTALEALRHGHKADRVADLLDHERFHFSRATSPSTARVDRVPRKCDTVLPLVASRLPRPTSSSRSRCSSSTSRRTCRSCAAAWARQAPGVPVDLECQRMSLDRQFDPESSPLVYGPISKPRWIYACAKQLMDRVIHAYGMMEGLTAVPPVQLIGSGLDNLNAPKEAARASSLSSSVTWCAASRSSWSTAAGRSAPLPTSTTASTR
jgi:UDP-4-amino-4-deoxy-L-arabinose formyltransferase/UDP-glucuronic acid dehydrogenase (UDP-4-keto-hexauronic acid decarboxylating)